MLKNSLFVPVDSKKNTNFRKKEIAMLANRLKRSASQQQMPVCRYIGLPGNKGSSQ